MKISFDESKNIIPSGRKHYTCNYCIDHFKTKCVLMHHNMKEIVLLQILHTILEKKICFDASHNVSTRRKYYSCNHCICHLQTKLVLINQRKFQHEENSILAITAYNNSKKDPFWFIREGPNMRKTIFLQSLQLSPQN